MFNKISDNFLRMIVRAYAGALAGIVGGILTSLVLTLVMKITGDEFGMYLVSPAMMAVGAVLGGIIAGIYGIVHHKE